MGSSSKSPHKHAAAIAPAGGTGVGMGAGGVAVAVAGVPAAPPLVQQLQKQGEILLSFLASGEYGKDAAGIKTFPQHAAPAAQGVQDLYNSADPDVAALPKEQKHAVWAPLAHGAAGYLKTVETLDLQIAA